MPVKLLITAGTVVDCTQAAALIDGIAAAHLLAERGYDTNKALAAARERGMTPVVIPPKRNRKVAREYDAALYARHLVEHGFERFKAWRGVATRYAKIARRTRRFAGYGLWLSGPR